MTVIAGRIVTPEAVVDGWIAMNGPTVGAIGTGPAPAGAVPAGDALVLPGFVDIHNHGGGGHSVTGGRAEEVRAAAAFHLRHGTTSMVASLVSAPPDQVVRGVRGAAEVVRAGDSPVIGVHLEGPFLAGARCGAHNPAHLLDPDPDLFEEFLAAGDGHVRVITIAPELPRAEEVIRRAVDAGVRVALGHSDADYDTARNGLSAGASIATHLFNAMPTAHHRHPGIAGAVLDDVDVVLELIVDGVHVHPAMVRTTFRSAGERIALITDAISAAGMPDGEYHLGPIQVRVQDGRARLAHGDALAGSTLTMDAAVRNALSLGVDPVTVARAAAHTPARALGLPPGVGVLAEGSPADLVILHPTHGVRGVMRGGDWAVEPRGD